MALAVAVLPLSAEPASAAPRRVRVESAPGETLLVHGTYPPTSSSCVNAEQPLLHARFRGDLEVHPSGNGRLHLIGELSFQDYLAGIAEVPRDWPMDALKAQVVAARSYALNQMRRTTASDYDLCATTACQVYVGTRVELGPWGQRWVRAIRETENEVLLHEGEPALAFYSSTSPGRTFDNEEVFGGTALPYLRGRRERHDRASPLSRWTVRMPFSHLARFLRAAGHWDGGRIDRVRDRGDGVVIRGRRDRVSLSHADLRRALNDTASCLDARYPTTEPDGYRLPQTVPSAWFRAEQDRRAIELRGRGWGHGVGLVQWGAHGRARRGHSYGEILSAYYRGLRPERVDVPDTIRILVAEGLTSVTIEPSGRARLRAGRARPRPPWRVIPGRPIRLRRGPPAPAVLEAGRLRVTGPTEDAPPGATLRLDQDARVRLEVLRGDQVVTTGGWEPSRSGRVELPVPDLAPGRYRVRAALHDGVDLVRTRARRLEIRGSTAAPSPTPSPSPAVRPPPRAGPASFDRRGGDRTAGAVMAGVILLLVGGGLLTARRRGRLHPP